MLTLWWAKFEGYVIAIGAALLAVGAAILYVFEEGKSSGEAKGDAIQAKQKANTAAAVASRTETSSDVDAKVAALPVNPVLKPTVPAPLPVPGSAADRLQSDWSRD